MLTESQEQERTAMEGNIEAWCDGLMEITFEVRRLSLSQRTLLI